MNVLGLRVQFIYISEPGVKSLVCSSDANVAVAALLPTSYSHEGFRCALLSALHLSGHATSLEVVADSVASTVLYISECLIGVLRSFSLSPPILDTHHKSAIRK